VSTFDVIVVGAGPAGAEAGRAAAESGLRTLIIEEHHTAGEPSHCTGKLSRHAFREFDLPLSLGKNSLRAALFHSPGGVSVHLRRAAVDSYVVDRVAFDRWLMDRAVRAGAEFVTGVRVTSATRDRGIMTVRGERRGRWPEAFAARSRLIIDAEGASPRLPGTLGLSLPRRYAMGLQYQMRGVGGLVPDTPEMFFGGSIAPGFFAWLMPLGGTRARVGLCIDPARSPRPPVWYLERLLATHPRLRDRVAGSVAERKMAGRIPFMISRAPTAAAGLLVAGDAAGQVKATSGGGIYYAMIAGRIAGGAAARYVAGDRGAGRAYEAQWHARFGREVAFTAFGRRMIDRLSDAELDAVLRSIAHNSDILAIIESEGDTQFQSRVFLPLLRGLTAAALSRPAMLSLVWRALVQGMAVQV
jgi:digeranylgeranylglycerophospholipid reductase